MLQTDDTNISEEPSLLDRTVIRFFSPRFNDELTQWFSTIPFISGIVQVIVSLISVIYGLLKLITVFLGSSKGGGGGFFHGLIMIITFFFALGLCAVLFFAYISGFFISFSIINFILKSVPQIFPLFLGMCLLGSLLKNTAKVQTMGVSYQFKKLYLLAAGITVILTGMIIFYMSESVDTDMFNRLGLSKDYSFAIPVAVISSIIIIFHCFIKPFITSCFIIFVAIAIKVDEKTALQIQAKKDQSDHSMGKARARLAIFRYLVILGGILFFAVLTFSELLGISDLLLTELDAPIPLSLAYQGVHPFIIAFWTSLVLWFAIMSMVSPQRSIIAKLIRRFKRNSNNASMIIFAVGLVTLLSTLYIVNKDLYIYPNDSQAREVNSTIYEKVQIAELLSERYYRKEAQENPKPLWVKKIALALYQQHKQAGTLDQLDFNLGRYGFKRELSLSKNKTQFYTEKIAYEMIPIAVYRFKEMCITMIKLVGFAILLGVLTKNIQHVSAYLLSALFIPLGFLLISTGSERIVIQTVTQGIAGIADSGEVVDKLGYSIQSGDWDLTHYREWRKSKDLLNTQ